MTHLLHGCLGCYPRSNDPRAHFGLGKKDAVDHIEVAWPDGKRERFSVGSVDRLITIHQGKGQAGTADEGKGK